CHAAPYGDAYRCYLPAARPDAGVAFPPPAIYAVIGERPDYRLFERADVGPRAEAEITEPYYGVRDQLARAVEGDVPSPARSVYLDSAPLYLILGQEEIPALSETAVGEDGRV